MKSLWIENNSTKTHFSLGNTKMGAIASISLAPIKSCVKGVPCAKCGQCYALRIYSQYSQVKNAWDINYLSAKNNPKGYFDNIRLFLSDYYKNNFFRWHVSGDILNQSYLNNMVKIANEFKHISFLAFTKNYYLNYKNIPENLQINFSAWANYPMPKKTKMPVVYVNDKHNQDVRIPNDAIHCKGNCEKCAICWKLNKLNKSVVIDKH